MSLKDKIIICLLIIFVISIGILVKSNADANIMGTTTDKELALLAKNHIDTFIGTVPNQSWFKQELISYVGKTGADSTIRQSSATCLYESQGWTGGSKYKITNVINMNWNPENNDYQAYGYWDGGEGFLNDIMTDSSKIISMDIFLQAVYNAYKTEKPYYTTTEKSAMKSLFYKAIENGGFLTTTDGGLNISSSFIEEKNGEALSYHDDQSDYTAQSLIDKYSNNTNSGYGLTNMDSSSIVDGVNITKKYKASDGNYTIFGPFNLYFYQRINRISIVGDAKSFSDGRGGQIYYSTSYDENTEGDWDNELANIPANKNFYIKVSDSGQEFFEKSPNIKITFQQKEVQSYVGRIILLKVANGTGQNLMIYGAKANPVCTPSIEFSVKQNDPADLIIEKKGEDNELQSNVNFRLNKDSLCAQWGNKEEQNGNVIYSNITFTNWQDNEQQVFKTSTSGRIIIKDLDTSYTYSLQETWNNNEGYIPVNIKDAMLSNGKASISLGITDAYKESMGDNYKNYINGIKLSNEQENLLQIIDKKEPLKEQFDITIKKTNGANEDLYGAEFKIKVFTKENGFVGWLKSDSTGYKYDTSYNNATIWTTSSSNNAQISINNLDKTYNYEIYETRAADGYNLSNQTQSNNMKVIIGSSRYNNNKIGYGDVDLGNNLGSAKLVFCGRVSHSQYTGGANLKVYNVTRSTSGGSSYVDISGRVWEDTYKKSYNNVYDNGDTVLNGVTVYLKRKSDGKEMYSTTTSNGGIYTFSGSNTGITSSSLLNYYIEIADSRIGSTYRIVEYGTGTNASKAKYQSSGRAWTDSIDSSNRLYMNIGIRPLPINEESIEKWVKNVQVKMNVSGQNYSYTYTYGKNNSSIGGVGSVGIGSATYYRTIYASDIAYKKESGVTNALEVYITYTMKVANDTSTYDNPIVGGKRELNMTTTVVDVYDSNYYILSDSNWTGSNGNARYKSTLTLNRKAKSGYYKELDITFKLTDKALNEILEKGSFTAGNRVEISGQHNYQIYEQIGEKPIYGYKWVGSGIYRRRVRYIVRYDPIYGWVNHSKNYDGENYAPGMTFSIYEYDSEKVAERKITGKVFEDNNIKTDGQVLGNGKYDSAGTGKENLVNKVTVELIQADNNKATGENQVAAKRYVYDSTESKGYKVLEGETYTGLNDKTGIYEFSGIIPGDYYVRFTYGDGTQKIFKNNTPTGETVTAYEYKSTIVTNSTLKNLIQKDRNKQSYSSSEYYWYRNTSILSSSLQYSTAVDILGDREYLNNNKITTYDIRAYTPTFRISLENENTTSGKNESKKYLIENMNFGIIDTPKISLGFEKVMTNIRVTNASGQVIIDGNPGDTSQNIKHLSNLDNKTTHLTQPGSDYAKIEINDEEIYGAKLEITYSITILNDSDVNYYESSSSSKYGYYYMFGDSAGAKEVNITVDEVQDYLDEKLTLTGNNHIISNKETYQNEYNILNINGGDWKPLYTKKKAATNSRAIEDTATIIVTRILSNEDTNIDTTFENQAEVIKIHVTDEPKLVENINKHNSSQYTNYFNYTVSHTLSNPSEYNSLIVTPPTGADKMTIIIYIAIAAVAGIIITIGIIVIKKKVLNK